MHGTGFEKHKHFLCWSLSLILPPRKVTGWTLYLSLLSTELGWEAAVHWFVHKMIHWHTWGNQMPKRYVKAVHRKAVPASSCQTRTKGCFLVTYGSSFITAKETDFLTHTHTHLNVAKVGILLHKPVGLAIPMRASHETPLAPQQYFLF